MQKKLITFMPRGMAVDLAPNAFSPEKSFETLNMRIFSTDSVEDGLNTLSLTNEKGNVLLNTVNLGGIVMGYAYIDDYAILIVKDDEGHSTSFFKVWPLQLYYVLRLSSLKIYSTKDIELDLLYSLETLVVKESEEVIKIYWTDSKHPVLVINIAPFIYNAEKDPSLPEKPVNLNFNLSGLPISEDTAKFNILKLDEGGYFSPGVIQYAYSYYNLHGQESAIVNCSELLYISTLLGKDNDSKVNCSFKITIDKAYGGFDYIRLYSIRRSSLNVTPEVKVLTDIFVRKENSLVEGVVVSFIDTGLLGYVVDPSLLYYLGGTPLSARTISQKNNVLFLGGVKDLSNYSINTSEQQKEAVLQFLLQQYLILTSNGDETMPSLHFTTRDIEVTDKDLSYKNYKGDLNLSQDDILTFKHKENYRVGILFLSDTGELSDVIYIRDIVNDLKPEFTTSNYTDKKYLKLPQLTCMIPKEMIGEKLSHGIKFRLMYVYPDMLNRTRVCQGIISPTVYEEKSRADGSLYTQPSWLFRDSSYKHKQLIDLEIQSSYGNDIYLSFNDVLENKTEVRDLYIWYDVKTPLPTVVYYHYYIQEFDGIIHHFFSFNNDLGGYDLAVAHLKRYHGNNTGLIIPSKEEWKSHLESGKEKLLSETYTINALEQIENKYRNNNNYYVDTSIVTFYSPEIELAYNVLNSSDTLDMQFIGIASIYNSYNDYMVTSSNTLRDIKSLGLLLRELKGTLKSALLWNDVTPDSNPTKPLTDPAHYSWVFRTYMWHRQGSLNADNSGDNVTIDDAKYDKQYSILDRKRFLNIREAEYVTAFNQDFYSNAVTDRPFKIHLNHFEGFYNLSNKYKYKGVINTVNVNSKPYPIFGNKVNPDIGALSSAESLSKDLAVINTKKPKAEDLVIYTNDPVPIKYKTADHIVIDLGKLLPNTLPEVPANTLDFTDYLSSEYKCRVDNLIVPNPNPDILEKYPTKRPEIVTKAQLEELGLYVGYTFFIVKSDVNNTKDFIAILKVSSINQHFDTSSQKPLDEYTVNYVSVPYFLNSNKDYNIHKIGFKFLLAVVQSKTIYSVTTETTKPSGFNDERYAVFRYKIWNHSVSEILGFPAKENGIYVCDIVRLIDNLYGGPLTNKNSDVLMSLTRWTPISKFYHINDTSNILTLQVYNLNLGLYESKDFYIINATRGDTYFLRWDCVNTSPYSDEDKNQVLDITSIFLESRINLDGRTDYRGDINYDMDYKKINSINPVYNQTDNFFSKVNTPMKTNINEFNSSIVYSLEKTNNEDIDSWSKINLNSILHLDSKYGNVSSLQLFNNTLYYFQDKAIGVVNYDDRVQIPVSDNVPIEISNSGKVLGNTYLSTHYGCLNKWSLVNIDSGIYFVDDYNKAILQFNGLTFNNLSDSKYMRLVVSESVTYEPWDFRRHSLYNKKKNIRTLYDKNTKDIYFDMDRYNAVAYNTAVGEFTSMYDYDNVTFLFTLNNHSYQVYHEEYPFKNTIWELHANDAYCNFFGYQSEYGLSVIANPEFLLDKIFDTVEFRCNDLTEHPSKDSIDYPFNTLMVQNEYQTAISSIDKLKKKFRIWRWLIGRDTNRNSKYKGDRIRNPWATIGLLGNSTKFVQLYDITVNYYI